MSAIVTKYFEYFELLKYFIYIINVEEQKMPITSWLIFIAIWVAGIVWFVYQALIVFGFIADVIEELKK